MTNQHDWKPTVRRGETLEDVPLNEWIGQALGAASTCWFGGTGDLEFDGSRARVIADSLNAHVQSVIQGVIAGTIKSMTLTDRDLLTAVLDRGLGRNFCATCQEPFPTPEEARAHVNAEHRAPLALDAEEDFEIPSAIKPPGPKDYSLKANLGLATTGAMLEELEARFSKQACWNAFGSVKSAEQGLNRTQLDYKPVES